MASPDVDSVGQDVLTVLRGVCRRPVEPSVHTTLAADLGFDSLQTLEFVAALEDRFGITVPIEQVPSIQTVGEVVACVQTLLAENAQP